jgi:DNA-directed RNA polymerase subunit omega
MARVTIEDCLEHVDSRFALGHLAVHRVLQMRGGSHLLVESPKNKEVVLSLREIAAGRVTPNNIRQLDDMRLFPDVSPAVTEDAARLEVREILEAETKYDASLEFPDAVAVEDTYQEEE